MLKLTESPVPSFVPNKRPQAQQEANPTLIQAQYSGSGATVGLCQLGSKP
jgi:hypothetical protein